MTLLAAAPPPLDDDYKRGYLCGVIRGDATIGSYTDGRSRRYRRFRLALADAEALTRARRYLEELGAFTAEQGVHRHVALARPAVPHRKLEG